MYISQLFERKMTMKIYKCDRCGKELANHDRNKVDVREWDNTIDRVDLCSNCLDGLYKFVYGKENDNERL